MKKHHLKILVPGIIPGIIAAAALVLAVGAGAQTTPPPGPPAAGKTSQAPPMAGHKDMAAGAMSDAGMKAECEAMMAKKKETQEKLEAMDAALDKLVMEMNAAKESKEADAMEKPMAAVINELVAQRKAYRSMMMEMQPEMMAHMMGHMDMHGKGAMDCPMMKAGDAPKPKPEEKKPEM